MDYLKRKDCAKILSDLYVQCFNWVRDVSIPGCQLGKYYGTSLTFEEIWAYEREIFFLEDSNPNILQMKREWNVEKRSYLLMVFNPLFEAMYDKKCIYTEKLDEFILENQLCKGIFEDREKMSKWLTFEAESIHVEDAKKIVQNVMKFWIERND